MKPIVVIILIAASVAAFTPTAASLTRPQPPRFPLDKVPAGIHRFIPVGPTAIRDKEQRMRRGKTKLA